MDSRPERYGHAGEQGFFLEALGELIAAAVYEAELDRPAAEGVKGTLREHYTVAARQGSAKARARLDGAPDVPEGLRFVWDWWMELHAARGEGMSGPAPLTYRDIGEWARLMGHDVEPHIVQALLDLDAAIRAAWREGPKGQTDG